MYDVCVYCIACICMYVMHCGMPSLFVCVLYVCTYAMHVYVCVCVCMRPCMCAPVCTSCGQDVKWLSRGCMCIPACAIGRYVCTPACMYVHASMYWTWSVWVLLRAIRTSFALQWTMVRRFNILCMFICRCSHTCDTWSHVGGKIVACSFLGQSIHHVLTLNFCFISYDYDDVNLV